jgi:hypothetical protein
MSYTDPSNNNDLIYGNVPQSIMATTPLSGPINDIVIDTSYSGFYYAFLGTGGFTMDQCFNNIKLRQEAAILKYDVTNSLQVTFDVRTFNEKIGLFKDYYNINIISSDFDRISDTFPNDNITIEATEFVSGMTTDQVISVGVYSTIYSDFIEFVNTYFGYAGGFSSLFSSASEFDINGGKFDASAFLHIITESNVPTQNNPTDLSNVKAVTGNITISNINALLKYAIDGDVFNNRNPQLSTGTASNPEADSSGNVYANTLYKSNYGMSDGFIAGDLIFIPAGTTINLHLVIDSENYGPLNNLGPANVSNLINSMDTSRTTTKKFIDANGNQNDLYTEAQEKIFTETTTATTTNIDRTLTAPLLIKLANFYNNT